jgi:hypothetical protein
MQVSHDKAIHHLPTQAAGLNHERITSFKAIESPTIEALRKTATKTG